MKIAVLSDIHDHIWNLAKALKVVKVENCEAIIFCGDFCAPFVGPYLVEMVLPIYAVFGNNDEDQWGIVKRVGPEKMKVFPLGDQPGEVELSGKKIALVHYPKLAQALAKTNEYDAVFYGHSHEASQENMGKTLLANPGAVCGIQSGKPGVATFGIYDAAQNSFKVVSID